MKHWDTRAESLLAVARSSESAPYGAQSRVKASIMASIALSGAAGAGASVVAGTTAMAKLPAAVKAASSVVPFAARRGWRGRTNCLSGARDRWARVGSFRAQPQVKVCQRDQRS